MFRILAGVAAAAASLLGAASAQMANPTGVMPNFDPQTVKPVIEELGGTAEVLQDGDFVAIGVIWPDGVRYLMYPTVCNDFGRECRGLSIQGLFEAGNMLPGAVNTFNQQGTIPKAVHEGQRVTLYHYLVADHGFLRGNFETHMGIMHFSIGRYLQFINGASPAQSVSLALSKNSGHTRRVEAVPDLHTGSIPPSFTPPKGYYNR
ncbi:type III secretion system chaperone family protein [Parvularcula lutaonensis]|uniref:YbjN domain-containing protein n=1 Tax=Parvularcula lutaonensis TaxID=491923 RepID=A0ABV7MB14_9PROT|nr:YbjN domain-containing protein [Parvularcula lutaonensis]GGY39231.1 hypothetical protein GCM10007148_04430 [Parvularcula lutaonensis]